jgi:hypothetical protein
VRATLRAEAQALAAEARRGAAPRPGRPAQASKAAGGLRAEVREGVSAAAGARRRGAPTARRGRARHGRRAPLAARRPEGALALALRVLVVR